ncbi:MAG: hypothetical protein LAO21_02395, partial [Acidobacteriia bacterium]|nr:hypothetical protein [Terriglobia bacterium]
CPSRWGNNGVAFEDNRLTGDRAEHTAILGWALGGVLPLDTTLRCVTQEEASGRAFPISISAT